MGLDFHEPSIAVARAKAVEEGADGAAGDVSFHVADSSGIGDGPFEVVTYFDALHDLGDPAASLRAAYEALTPRRDPRRGRAVVERRLRVAHRPAGRADQLRGVDCSVHADIARASRAPTVWAPRAARPAGCELLAEAGFVDAVVAADTGFNLVLRRPRIARPRADRPPGGNPSPPGPQVRAGLTPGPLSATPVDSAGVVSGGSARIEHMFDGSDGGPAPHPGAAGAGCRRGWPRRWPRRMRPVPGWTG